MTTMIAVAILKSVNRANHASEHGMATLSELSAHLHQDGFTAAMKTDLTTGIIHGRIINTDRALTFEGRTLQEFRRALANTIALARTLEGSEARTEGSVQLERPQTVEERKSYALGSIHALIDRL